MNFKDSEIAPEKAHKTLQWRVRHVTAVICRGNDIQAVQLTFFLSCPNLVNRTPRVTLHLPCNTLGECNE